MRNASKKEWVDLAAIVLMVAVVFILALAYCESVYGADYYINNQTGSNDNPGTVAQPFKNVNGINGMTLGPGDTVSFSREKNNNGTLKVFGWRGTEAQPIVIRSYGEHQSNPVAYSQAWLYTSGPVIDIRNSSNIVVSNLKIRSSRNGGVSVKAWSTNTIDPEPSENIMIRGCTFEGYNDGLGGVTLSGTEAPISNVVIEGNSFDGFPGSAITAVGEVDWLRISDNIITDTGLTRDEPAIKLSNTSNVHVERNLIRYCRDGIVSLGGTGEQRYRWNTVQEFSGEVAVLAPFECANFSWCNAGSTDTEAESCCAVGCPITIHDYSDPCGLTFPPTPTPTRTPTPTSTPTPTPWPTWTPAATWTPAPTWTPPPTYTPTATPTATATPSFPPPATESVCAMGQLNWATICLNETVPDDVDCDAALVVGRSLCYYAWTEVRLPIGADGSASCGLVCPYCETIHRANPPAVMPTHLYDRTDDLMEWFGYPALEVPDSEYTCAVRCPTCGRIPEWIGRFDPIWTTAEAE